MHVNNNFYFIILGNHSRNSWPIFPGTILNRFLSVIYDVITEKNFGDFLSIGKLLDAVRLLFRQIPLIIDS